MGTVAIEYCTLDGSGASVGRAGTHTVIADRPEGKAGGNGLGFNGAQLLALSLGGCFCNDVHYTADEMGVSIARLRVGVDLDLEGSPLLATAARVSVEIELEGGVDATALLARAQERCTVANSLRKGMEVEFG